MIENLKDLKALLKLCRQAGVTEINLGTVSLKLGEMPRAIQGDIEEMSDDEFISDIEAPLSNEELVAFAQGA